MVHKKHLKEKQVSIRPGLSPEVIPDVIFSWETKKCVSIRPGLSPEVICSIGQEMSKEWWLFQLGRG